MSDSEPGGRPAKYCRGQTSEYIWGTKEQIQSFGIAIGLAFPGEPNGPKRQLKVRDPRGFEVKVTKTYWKDQPFSADITYPGLPPQIKPLETTPFLGVKKVEYFYVDMYTGRGVDLINAGLVTAAQLPGAPGMRKRCVSVLADGSTFDGPRGANIPGGNEPGARRIERSSSRSTTFSVHVRVDQAEVNRREAVRDIASSAWLHEVRKLSRPRALTACYGDTVGRQANAVATARSDVGFQALLGKLSMLPAGEAS